MMDKISQRRRSQGFSLIELLVVGVIGIIILYEAFNFFYHQQNVFRQQSEQAEKQANLRVALYYLIKDLSIAGYTGTAFGVELPIYTAQRRGLALPEIRAVRPIEGSTLSALSGGLTNANNQPLDAIEIWANFAPEGATSPLAIGIPEGTNVVYAETVDGIFYNSIWDEVTESYKNVYPTGVVIAGVGYELGDYLPITAVDTSSKTITGSGSLLNKYEGGRDEAAPILRRVYFVRQESDGERWLIRRDYYSGGWIDHRMAQGIEDFQVYFDLMRPTDNQFEVDVDSSTTQMGTPIDPCWITAVRVQLQAKVKTQNMKRPMVTTMTRKVKLMNVNRHPLLQNCP